MNHIICTYILIGLVVMTAYVTYVGKLISKKYGCGLLEGIARFENADNAMSNLKAVLICVITWPSVLRGLFTGGRIVLEQMVKENDY